MLKKRKRNLLGEFVQGEISRRKMTVNEFAEKSDIAHTILFRILKGAAIPTLGTLAKLARYTHTDIGILARLVMPDATYETIPDVQIIAEQINRLPVIYREAMIAMIRALLAEQERAKDGE